MFLIASLILIVFLGRYGCREHGRVIHGVAIIIGLSLCLQALLGVASHGAEDGDYRPVGPVSIVKVACLDWILCLIVAFNRFCILGYLATGLRGVAPCTHDSLRLPVLLLGYLLQEIVSRLSDFRRYLSWLSGGIEKLLV